MVEAVGEIAVIEAIEEIAVALLYATTQSYTALAENMLRLHPKKPGLLPGVRVHTLKNDDARRLRLFDVGALDGVVDKTAFFIRVVRRIRGCCKNPTAMGLKKAHVGLGLLRLLRVWFAVSGATV